MEKIFKTKYEYCHIDADKILIAKMYKNKLPTPQAAGNSPKRD